MEREPPRQRWEREALSRGFNYHDRQAARDRNDFPAAKRGRRETSPGYPSYRDTGSNLGPAFPTGPRDRFEGFPPDRIPRGRGMPGRGYHPMPEQRRGPYPIAPPLARPPPPIVWPGPEHRDIRDIPSRAGQFYSQRDNSPTPSPRSWQAPPHALEPGLSVGAPHLHGPLRYGSPAHFDQMAPTPREASHVSNHPRFQEEAERRPSPRALNRPLSRGPSMERAVWQQPLMRGSGPGLGPFVPGGQGLPRPAMAAGPPRRDAGYRYSQSQGQPAPSMGAGRSMDERTRLGSGRGPAPFTRGQGQGQGQGQDRPVGVPFSRGQGQDRPGSAPRGRSLQQGRASAPLRVETPAAGSPAGPGVGAPPHRTSSRASARTPERSQRSSARGRDGSRDSRKDSHRERSRDTAQRQHSSSSRPSRAASGATGHSPMRSSESGVVSAGASRDLARRQLSGKHDSPPPKSRLSAPHLATTAASSQAAEAARPPARLSTPPAASTPLPPPPKLPPPAADPLPPAPNASLNTVHTGPAGIQLASSDLDHASQTASTLAASQLPLAEATAPPADAARAAAPAATPAAVTAATPAAATAAVSVNSMDTDLTPELPTAAQTEVAPPRAPPVVEEPVPKRPKLQFGKGLASRMSSAAQSELTLPESTVTTAEVQQTQPTQTQPTQPEPQPDSQTRHHTPEPAQEEQLKLESCSPPVAETSLEALLAQNSPGSLHRSSWVQIHKDLLTLNNHKARLQDSITNLSEQEGILKQEVEQAQARQEAEDRRQQQQLQEQRAKAVEEEENIVSKLDQTDASIAQLRDEMQQVPVLSEVSQSEEEDLVISSSDDSGSESDSDHAAAALQNGYHDPPPGAYPNGPRSSSKPNGMVAAEADGRQLSLTQMLKQLRPDNRPRPRQLGSLVCLLGHDQIEAQVTEVYDQNRDMLMLDWEKHEAVLPSASIPVASDKVDVAKLALVKQILEDHQKQKHAMMRHLQQRKNAKVLKQIEAAARYNAAHEQLQVHNAGQNDGDFTQEERARIVVAKERIRQQVVIPDQILDPHERRASIFVDRNNQYDLREAREVEQASLRLDPADQKKFGTAFVKFPKKWGKIAEIMGDRTPFQCAMIYNDQKDYDWFHPWLSQYGRTKRRSVGNRQQRFLSSANAITARPDSADKPPRGRVTTVVATAVTNQGPLATEVPSRAARGRSRVAATRGSARGPALRGRPTRTGGMSVATAVVTATEGEEAATMDTAAVTSSAAGAAPTITRNRYEFDLPWTPEEEHRLLEGYKLHTKPAEQAIDSAKSLTNWRAVALHVGSRTQKASKAHMKKLHADPTVAASHQPQHSPLLAGALPHTGQPAASPELGTSMTHATPSSSAGLVPMAEDDGPGALEAVERLEGSPPLENGLQQPLHPHQEQHQDGPGDAEAAAANPEAQQQQQQQQSQAQAEAARLTDNLFPDWTATASGPFAGTGLVPANSLPQGSAAGAASASLAPMVFPGQAALHPAILQFLFGQLGQAQQPQGPSQGAPQGLSQGAPSQGAPQGQQLAQPVPLSLPFIPPIYQAFMQQQMAAASSAGFPQQPYGSMPSYLQPPPGLGSLPQPLLPGHFGMLQSPGVGVSPSQALLQPPDSSALTGGPLPLLPGVSSSDQPFILQPPYVPQQAEHGAGQGREWPLQGQDGASGPERGSLLPSGAAEQVQGEVRVSAADRQDSASQGQQETAQSLQADSAPGSSTGPDGPPSVSKGGKRGGSKSIASAPKRQMNFWQEEEKAQFLNAYRMHGVDWDMLAKEIPTKEKTQIKNYYQNYKQRLELDQIELPQTAKHPKPSRGPSRASTPRPASARAGSRQNSESGDPVQAMMDEAVEAATAAAAAAVTSATDSQAMEIEAATVSHAGLPGRDSGDSQLRGSDSQLRGSSPDAVVPMSELPFEPLRGTPVRGVDPSRAVSPQPRSNTPPPSHPPSWGPADGIRQAWQGGALIPNAPVSESTPKPRVPPSPTSCWGLTRMRRGRPSLSPQAPSHTSAMPETLQAITDLKPPSLLTSSSTKRAEEEVEHSVQPGSVSAADVAKEAAGLPMQTSSSSQLGPTTVSVSVSVRDDPVGAPAQTATTVNPQGRPTLLPHSSLSHPASTSSPGLLVPSVLRDLAAGQGQSSQPKGGPGRESSPCSPMDVEHRTNDTQAATISDASGTTHDAQISSAQASGDMACPAGSSGQLEQAPALESALTGHNQDPPSSAAGVGDPNYNLKSAISQQFESLPGRTPPGPKEGPHGWPLIRSRSRPQPKPEPEAATPHASIHSTQDVPRTDPSLSHIRHHASLTADRLISDSFDRLGQGSSGGDAAALETDSHGDSQLQPDKGAVAGQDNDTEGQQQNQE